MQEPNLNVSISFLELFTELVRDVSPRHLEKVTGVNRSTFIYIRDLSTKLRQGTLDPAMVRYPNWTTIYAISSYLKLTDSEIEAIHLIHMRGDVQKNGCTEIGTLQKQPIVTQAGPDTEGLPYVRHILARIPVSKQGK
jgi:hypothetical protein